MKGQDRGERREERAGEQGRGGKGEGRERARMGCIPLRMKILAAALVQLNYTSITIVTRLITYVVLR